jgi:hypothetical protein
MEASLQEKLYFLNQLHSDVEYVLDFGCADGALLDIVKKSGYKCFGIDNEPEMQKLARQRLGNDVRIFNSVDEYLKIYPSYVNKTAIILSSVVHEIFSYSSLTDAIRLINQIFQAGFKQICIRDMGLNQDMYYTLLPGNIDLTKVKNHKLYNSYVTYLGHDIETYKDLYHFLLKYRYEDNWKRELPENYVMFSLEELLNVYSLSMSKYKYNMSFFEHKCLEFTRGQVYKDFGFTMSRATNYKVIYTKM